MGRVESTLIVNWCGGGRCEGGGKRRKEGDRAKHVQSLFTGRIWREAPHRFHAHLQPARPAGPGILAQMSQGAYLLAGGVIVQLLLLDDDVVLPLAWRVDVHNVAVGTAAGIFTAIARKVHGDTVWRRPP